MHHLAWADGEVDLNKMEIRISNIFDIIGSSEQALHFLTGC